MEMTTGGIYACVGETWTLSFIMDSSDWSNISNAVF